MKDSWSKKGMGLQQRGLKKRKRELNKIGEKSRGSMLFLQRPHLYIFIAALMRARNFSLFKFWLA